MLILSIRLPRKIYTCVRESQSFLYKLTLFSAIGGFLFGYDTGVVSGAMLLLNEKFDLHTIEQELVVTVTVATAALFSIIGGMLNKSMGRRKTIIIASALTPFFRWTYILYTMALRLQALNLKILFFFRKSGPSLIYPI